jgi:hypothetical protein
MFGVHLSGERECSMTRYSKLLMLGATCCLCACDASQPATAPGQPHADIALRYSISHVLTSAAIVGAEVCYQLPKDTIACATTDENGVAETLWPNPKPGNTLVTVSKEGYLTDAWTGHYDDDVRKRWQQAQTTDDDFVHFQYTIPPISLFSVVLGMVGADKNHSGGHVFFWVKDEQGEGIEGVEAEVLSDDGASVGPVYYPAATGAIDLKQTGTTAAGLLTTVNIPTGDVTVKVKAAGLTCTPLETYHSGTANAVTVPVLAAAMTKGSFVCK